MKPSKIEILADPLPEDFDEGDSAETETLDDNDTPPGTPLPPVGGRD